MILKQTQILKQQIGSLDSIEEQNFKNSFIKENKMKLSDQAMGALMMVLQKCLMEQSDIVPMLKELDFVATGNDELSVTNPPTVHLDEEQPDESVLEKNA